MEAKVVEGWIWSGFDLYWLMVYVTPEIKRRETKMAGKGFEAVAKWKKESDERKAQYEQGYTPFFLLKDGEQVEGLWFNGSSDDEPLIVDIHTVALVDKKTGKKRWITVIHREDECVPCYLRANGDNRISKVQQRSVLSVADPRFVHKMLDKDRSTEEKKRYKFVECINDEDGEGKCKYCKKGKKRERAGQKRVEFSMTWANALGTTDEQLRRKCSCGGKIKRGECSKCDSGTNEQLNIFRVPFTITRAGSDKSTTYQFVPGAYEDMPDWVAELSPPNLEALYKEPTPDQQAERIGVVNPFRSVKGRTQKGASSYDDADDDDIFGGDEEE